MLSVFLGLRLISLDSAFNLYFSNLGSHNCVKDIDLRNGWIMDVFRTSSGELPVKIPSQIVKCFCHALFFIN